MYGLDLFSGIGGLSLALSPWVRTIAYCESDRYAQGVLMSRMWEGALDLAPIWDDVRTLQLENLGSPVDMVFGGFPCQDLSDASRGRGGGIDGDRSGLWREMLRIIGELRPKVVFIENVDGAAWKEWVPVVRGGLHLLGYSSVPIRVRASDVGAPYEGSRVFVAASNRQGESTLALDAEVAGMSPIAGFGRENWREPPSRALGVADGIPERMERLRACGNAVVPLQAREGFRRFIRMRTQTCEARGHE